MISVNFLTILLSDILGIIFFLQRNKERLQKGLVDILGEADGGYRDWKQYIELNLYNEGN